MWRKNRNLTGAISAEILIRQEEKQKNSLINYSSMAMPIETNDEITKKNITIKYWNCHCTFTNNKIQ